MSTNQDSTLPWKTLDSVAELIEKSTDLTNIQKGLLSEMIASQHANLLSLIADAASLEDMTKALGILANNSGPSSSDMNVDTDDGANEGGSDTDAGPFEMIQESLNKINECEKKGVAASATKTIHKMLENVLENPDRKKNRQLLTKNFTVKKYILEVDGALDLLVACGWGIKQVGRKEYLCIDPSAVAENAEIFDIAIALLGEQIEENDDAKAREASNPKPKGPRQKCKGGCNFFGDPDTEGYCSMCFKKKYFGSKSDEKENDDSKAPKKCKTETCELFGSVTRNGYCSVCYEAKNQRPSWKKRLGNAMVKLRAMRRFQQGRRPVQENKSRCWKCRRRVGISGIECRCRYVFCGKHRYASEHDCPFDYKKLQRRRLDKENKRVIAAKFERIQSTDPGAGDP